MYASSIARLTAAVLAASAIFAGAASAAPRSFTLDFSGGALGVDELALPITDQVTVTGSVDDNGVVSVPAAGLTFPVIHQPGLFDATITAVGDGTGTFNDATGGMLLNLPLRIGIADNGSGDKFPDGCAMGSAATPIRLALKTYGPSVALDELGATLSGSPFNRATGAIALTDGAPELPLTDNCGGGLSAFLAMDWTIGLLGKLTIPEKAAPPATNNGGGGGGQTPAPSGGTAPAAQAPAPPAAKATAPSTTKKLSKLLLTAPDKQKGIKSGGTVLGIEVDQPAKAVLSASVKIGTKTTKLAAISRTLKTGRASVAVSFPSALRTTVQRALRARKSVVVTISVTATDAAGTRLTRSRQIRLTR
jgi:hypothetical protein